MNCPVSPDRHLSGMDGAIYKHGPQLVWYERTTRGSKSARLLLRQPSKETRLTDGLLFFRHCNSSRNHLVLLICSCLPETSSSRPEKRGMKYCLAIIFVTAAACLLASRSAPCAEIHEAVKLRDTARIEQLLVKGPRGLVNARTKGGSTPLHWAAVSQAPEVARVLIENGADINARTDTGSTPLHWAANKNAVSVAKLLIESGADVNARSNKGYTPLHWAAIGNSDLLANLLFIWGADINAKADDGKTPLHLAIQMEAIETIEVLMANEAGLYAKANDGSTPLSLIKSTEVRELLERLIAESETGVPDVALVKSKGRKSEEKSHLVRNNLGEVGRIKAKECADGTVYTGEWQDGKMHGRGTLTFPNGEKYTGQWVRGGKHGEGRYVFPNGEKYEGQWRNGMMHGRGVYTFSNGGCLEGVWYRNRFVNGTGTYNFADGDKYEGQWRNDKMWGHGVYTTAGGQKFEGYWRANQFIGKNAPSAGFGMVIRELFD